MEEEEEEEGRDIEDVKKTNGKHITTQCFWFETGTKKKIFFNINTDNETLNKQERFT